MNQQYSNTKRLKNSKVHKNLLDVWSVIPLINHKTKTTNNSTIKLQAPSIQFKFII